MYGLFFEWSYVSTRTTLFLHIKKTIFASLCDKFYDISKPNLLKPENGWSLKAYRNAIGFEPVRCVFPLGPKAFLEPVKFGWKKTCTSNCFFSEELPSVYSSLQMLCMHGTVIVATLSRRVTL